MKKKKEAIISAKNLKKSFTTKDRSQDIFDQLAVFRRKNCGFVFQQIYLLENMSLMDNVITAGALVNKNRKEITKKASELFEIIYVFLTIFLYLLKCPNSPILSAIRAFCISGKPHISRSNFLYFSYQTWLKSW